MGDLTRAQLRAEVAANLGGRTDLESGDPLNTVNRALDRVQTRILRANSNGWSELKALFTEYVVIDNNPGTDQLYTDLPNHLDRISAIMVKPLGDTLAYRVTEMLRSQWDSFISVSSAHNPGRILKYIDERRYEAPNTYSRRLRWWPPPSSDYSLYKYFRFKPTPFTSNSQVSDFEDKDDLIIAGVTQYMFKRYQMFEEAEEWRKHFNVERDEAIRLDRLKPDVHAVLLGANPTRGLNISPINPWQDPFVRGNRR